MIKYIVKYTQLPERSVQNTIELLNQDCTIPFISRYRKEKTGNLDEVRWVILLPTKLSLKL